MGKLYKINIPDKVKQRGTGHIIKRKDAIVYDFMPLILGERFRTNPTLSRMLLRPAPEQAPLMLTTEAYETLGMIYVSRSELIPAMECYRVALDSATGFARAMAAFGEYCLLSQHEINHMDISTKLETELIQRTFQLDTTIDQKEYASWVEKIRESKRAQEKLNMSKATYYTIEYAEACIAIGEYEEALSIAKHLGDKKLVRRVKTAAPKEILDLKFLKKHIDTNFPESSMCP